MLNTERIHYFGKLRRRREFIRAAGLSRDYYYDWEVWFNKCSNANSLLPFLSGKNKVKPLWLFIINESETLKVGLTTLSSDMAARKYPFLVYFEREITRLENTEDMLTSVLSMAGKYAGFINTVANGNFTVDEEQYFMSRTKNCEVADQLEEILKCIVLKILEKTNDSIMESYWINLDSFYTINHQGALTCTLYNKIYG